MNTFPSFKVSLNIYPIDAVARGGGGPIVRSLRAF